MDNTLILEKHGAEAEYKVTTALFCISEDGKLSCSVEAELADREDEDSPREIMLAVIHCDFDGAGTTVRVRDTHDTWDKSDEAPHAFVYSGFHHSNVDARIAVDSHDSEQLTVAFTVLTDDVTYYDERAGASTIRGRCVLVPGEMGDLWSP